MHWIQIHIDTTAADAPLVENTLLAVGAQSVTLSDRQDQPILEPAVGETPLWQSVRVTGLFPNQKSVAEITDDVAAQLRIDTTKISAEVVANRAWEREWLNHYQPIQCGERLQICPSWQQPPAGNSVNLLLDPGLAFGTGTHETTLLCLQWLDQANLDNKTVLDFGCGSGILGIAAILLGARQACFVDIDPQALTATRANLEKNAVGLSQYQICAAGDFQPSAQFDIVMANILAKPLIAMAPDILQCLTADGQIVLSGLQSEQIADVANAYSHSVQFSPAETLNDWSRLSGKMIEG